MINSRSSRSRGKKWFVLTETQVAASTLGNSTQSSKKRTRHYISNPRWPTLCTVFSLAGLCEYARVSGRGRCGSAADLELVAPRVDSCRVRSLARTIPRQTHSLYAALPKPVRNVCAWLDQCVKPFALGASLWVRSRSWVWLSATLSAPIMSPSNDFRGLEAELLVRRRAVHASNA